MTKSMDVVNVATRRAKILWGIASACWMLALISQLLDAFGKVAPGYSPLALCLVALGCYVAAERVIFQLKYQHHVCTEVARQNIRYGVALLLVANVLVSNVPALFFPMHPMFRWIVALVVIVFGALFLNSARGHWNRRGYLRST